MPIKYAKWSHRRRRVLLRITARIRTQNELEHSHQRGSEIHHSSSFAVDSRMLKSRSYLECLQSITDDSHEKREFTNEAIKILKHRSGTDGEDISVYNRTLREWYRSWAGSLARQVTYSPGFTDCVEKHKDDYLISFHNHPNGTAPSTEDINSALQNDYDECYTLGHNGTIFKYCGGKYEISQYICDQTIAKLEVIRYTEVEQSAELIRQLASIYKFTFEEVSGPWKRKE